MATTNYKIYAGKVPKDVTNRRRQHVADLWVEGLRYTEIVKALEERLGETWTRQCVAKDVQFIRKQCAKEGKGSTTAGHRCGWWTSRCSRKHLTEA